MEKSNTTLEELLIWQEGMKICYQIYDVLLHCHDFGLKNQMERSAVSIPSNIAEGYELNTDRQFIRHLFIAKGSCGELRTQLYIAVRQKYIDENTGVELINSIKKLSGMTQNFIIARRKRMLISIVKSVLSLFNLQLPLH